MRVGHLLQRGSGSLRSIGASAVVKTMADRSAGGASIGGNEISVSRKNATVSGEAFSEDGSLPAIAAGDGGAKSL